MGSDRREPGRHPDRSHHGDADVRRSVDRHHADVHADRLGWYEQPLDSVAIAVAAPGALSVANSGTSAVWTANFASTLSGTTISLQKQTIVTTVTDEVTHSDVGDHCLRRRELQR